MSQTPHSTRQTPANADGGRIVLSVRSLAKTFGGAIALADANLDVRAGEIHAVVGENGAGKSTLMNIISGNVLPDSGEMIFEGVPVRFTSPSAAMRAGVGIVHQELSLCADVSVAENIFLGDPLVTRFGMLAHRRMNREAAGLLAKFDASAHPTDRLGDLTLAEQQVVEIARTIRHESQLIIFDEPTSSLTETESAALYVLIRDLKRQGMSCIYISHRMSEVFSLSDVVTVMRDGRWVSTSRTKDVTPDEIITQMVGRPIARLYPPKASTRGEAALAVTGASRVGAFQDISFTAHRGEIVGFSGLVGSGRTELMKAVVGIDALDAGTIELDGELVTLRNYPQAVARGVCYMTEDRKLEGLFLERSLSENINAAVLPQISRAGIVRRSLARANSLEYAKSLNIKYNDLEQAIGRLSGGNQQKAMIAKWLLANPKVLILDEPTRGIDVGAKHEIHALLRTLADAGLAIVVVSSEMPEIVGLCDRVMVLSEGRLAGELTGDAITEDSIVSLAAIAPAA